ncbi:MAG: DEAD/DEAH box helicase [Deltaproteobacteria bacterium]|nr:DEAD/DEAH box helicase [Deltaproteobacteria bacterium]
MPVPSSDHVSEIYAGLTPLGKFLVQLSSVVYISPSLSGLYRIYSEAASVAPGRRIKSARTLERHLRDLQDVGIVDQHFRCRREFVERASRLALAEGRYEVMAKAVLKLFPRKSHFFESRARLCGMLMRDFRIGFHTGDTALCSRAYSELGHRCRQGHGESDPFVQVCMEPFDRQWFRTVPLELQVTGLTAVFQETVARLTPDHPALEYALDPGFLRSVPRTHRLDFYRKLAERLLVGGRFSEAAPLIDALKQVHATEGLLGSLTFMEGRLEKACDLFDMELASLRKRLGKRNVSISGLPGLFHVLALLLRQDGALLRPCDQLLARAEARQWEDPGISAAYRALRAIYCMQNCEPENARELLVASEKSHHSFAALFSVLASYWIDGRLTAAKIDVLSNLFIRSREVGLNWFAMECAMLLSRAERDTPVRRNFIEKVEESGARSFVGAIRLEEEWRKSLRALILTASGHEDFTPERSGHRLVWLLQYANGSLDLQPVEQRVGAKGVWTKGRPVSLARFYSGSKLEFMTAQDAMIRSALSRSANYFRGYSYRFDMERVLPALVGHPLVFLKSSPWIRAEVVRGEPEVLVTRERNDLRLQFSPRVGNARVALVHETPTRFRVVQLTEDQMRMARIIGERGLSIPESAKEEVLSAISAISSKVMVHSAIGGPLGAITEVEADPTPHIHLLPVGDGFSLEMFVLPFGEVGPYLKPGLGAENVIAEVEGRRLQARRDLSQEEAMADRVESSSSILSGLPERDRRWRLEGPEQCLQVLLDLKEMQEKGHAVVKWPEGEKLKVTRPVSFDRLHLSIRGKNDWFEVDGHLALDDGIVLEMRKLLDMLRDTPGRFIPLDEGCFLALTHELRKRLEELEAFSEKRGKEYRLHPLASLALEDLLDRIPHLDADIQWRSRIASFRAVDDTAPIVPSTFKAELRHYQLEGFKWLVRLARLGVGGCLADDMGLGKTIQALALLLYRASGGPALVVAPTSVCMNWLKEAARFAPTLNPLSFAAGNREEMIRSAGPFDLVVCSYGLLLQEASLLASIRWNTIVLDEAQAIKNMSTKRSQAAMNLNGNFKLITTGTPIENHLSEFWTLFNFINPGLLGSFKRFSERFALPIEKYGSRDAAKRLKKLIMPFVLRRLKSEVLEELPPRTEIVMQVEMTPGEAAFYEALREQALERVGNIAAPAGEKHLRILAEIMRLRLACCNTRLVTSESRLPSAKLDLFGDIVAELLENGHKALVFSQFVGHLALIREYLDRKGISYRYLDGSTSARDREREVSAFQLGDGDLFLISLKAGGLGLNLTAADYVIHMDPWWNPAVEDQAADRAHRIGQRHPVTVYKLVTRGTIEEKILNLHREKRDLAASLLDGTDVSGKVSAEELLQLIRED